MPARASPPFHLLLPPLLPLAAVLRGRSGGVLGRGGRRCRRRLAPPPRASAQAQHEGGARLAGSLRGGTQIRVQALVPHLLRNTTRQATCFPVTSPLPVSAIIDDNVNNKIIFSFT